MIGYPIGVPKGYPMPYPNRGRIAHTRIARTGPYRPGPYRTPTTPARLHHSVAVGNARDPINAMMRCAESGTS